MPEPIVNREEASSSTSVCTFSCCSRLSKAVTPHSSAAHAAWGPSPVHGGQSSVISAVAWQAQSWLAVRSLRRRDGAAVKRAV